MGKDYFKILNLTPPASEESIKQAYRELAKKYHPDVNHTREAHDRFVEISEAYEFLIDQLKKSDNKTVIYDQDDVSTREYLEEMRRRARERAQERARMKFEKLQKEHEAFRESGLYDLGLVFSYLGRFILFLICFFLVLWAVAVTVLGSRSDLGVRFILFSIGATGLYFILRNARSYFFAGKFFYGYKQFKKIFDFRDAGIQEKCYFSPKHIANSYPYKIDMFKIKDIQLHNYGPIQHSVSFNQKSTTLSIPRSHHALVIHALLKLVKLAILAACLMFLDVSSVLWRFIIALFLSFFVSKIVLLATNTKSTISYLLTPSLIIRCFIWLMIVMAFSGFQFHPFDVFTTEHIYVVVFLILIFDTFLDQFLNFISKRQFQVPLVKQHPLIQSYLDKKYQFGYDMPFLSVFYPIYKWFLG